MGLKKSERTINSGDKMIEYFFESEFTQIKKQRKKVLVVYFVVLSIYLIISLGLFLWFRTLPFMSSKISTIKWIHYPITAVFVIFTFIYLGIPYKRVNRYYALLRNMMTGLTESAEGSFFEYDESVHDKDGVDVKALIFLQWNKFKKDYFERKVFVPIEKEFPEFKENEEVRYVTQGNMLVRYEILPKGEQK